MGYFDDLRFVTGAVTPDCTAFLDRRFPGTWSLEFCLAGRMLFQVDGGPESVQDGPFAFWHHPRHRYRYGAVDSRGWDHHWILMQGARARRMVDALMSAFPLGWSPVAEPLVLAKAFHDLVALVQTADADRHARSVVLLEGMVAMLLDRRVADDTDPGRSAVARIAAAVRAEPFQLVDFAVEAARQSLSHSHFRRLFRRHIGRSPHAFLLQCRMETAARRLQDSPGSIASVARSLGYPDPVRFTKLFRSRIGLTPGRFRAVLLAADPPSRRDASGADPGPWPPPA